MTDTSVYDGDYDRYLINDLDNYIFEHAVRVTRKKTA